ncbi:MAG: ABC transporter permease subunit [Thermoleophilia bacterium]
MRSLRLELIKILHQKRTYIGWVGLVLVPLIVLAAGALEKPRPADSGDPPFVTHVSQNGLLVMLAALYALASFLLPIIAAMGGASSVASEAEGGTLKTWLSRPVSRTGVLLTKWTMAVLYALAGAALVAAVSLLAGVAVFGLHPLVTLSGTTLSAPHALALIGVAYLLVVAGAVCSLSIALFISTFSDSSLTAATIAIAVFTVLTILNAFSVFDFMKPYTYSSYRLVFLNLFRYPIYWHPIRQALVNYGVTAGALLLASWVVFSRKDVLT